MASPDPFSVPLYPPELVRGLVREAEADARRVCLFLDALGFSATPERPVHLPAEFLLDLAAALRLLCWEHAGLQPQAIGNLPLARDAIRVAFQTATTPPRESEIGPPGSLAQRVVMAFIDHFAWDARVELGADVMLGEADEDAILAAFADFLWEHRPR